MLLCTSADVGGVLSHSRERTKGRPVAAKSRQHHGCPRTPRRLAWGWSLLLREAIGFLAGAAWRGFGCCVARLLTAGRHRWAALVAREVVGLAGRVTACRLAWRDRLETVRFSASVHGRRSQSSLRRPPQEVAASLNHDGARNPHAKRGDRRGAPPERNQPNPFPGGEGVTAVAVTDRGSLACSASRRTRCAP